MPERKQISNKGTYGRVLNFAGMKNYIGAAYLSSVSALKVGCGFVALATENEVIHSVSTLLPETVYLSREEGLKSLEYYTVILAGCGLGLENKSINLFTNMVTALNTTTKPSVIDADGLNILAKLMNDNLNVIVDFANNKNKNCILTPHPLEAARLLSKDLETVLADLEGAAKELSNKYNSVVVLKTHRTIICDGKNLFINQHGNSALAKAGTGDVLAGIIAGLLAQGVIPFEAAKLGVYLHSIAGEFASKELTEYSVLASDLPNFLHKAIKTIL